MARETTTWTNVSNLVSGYNKRCDTCFVVNSNRKRVCACGRIFRGRRKKARSAKPKSGTDARIRHDLKHAARMVDEWSAKAARAITTLRKWRARERRLWDRLVEGPPPPRPKRKRKLRAIRLED